MTQTLESSSVLIETFAARYRTLRRSDADCVVDRRDLVPTFQDEFWTSRQRQGSSLHEVSYRACFKAELPRFFISLLTKEGDLVYDPFLGRGTTAVEAALLDRVPIGNDINPLSRILTEPRLAPPSIADIARRLEQILFEGYDRDIDLSMYYHPDTEREIRGLRKYLLAREADSREDAIDRWIRMVATNRLTGHSAGFFSVYSLPPNQATLPSEQVKINTKLNQSPPRRDVRSIILKKTQSLLKDLTARDQESLRRMSAHATLLTGPASQTPSIKSESVALVVTSPPFLNIVEYSKDNWLRCWFNGIDSDAVGAKITMASSVRAWAAEMGSVFAELFRIVRPGGYVAFEVGEIRTGSVNLDEVVLPIGTSAGFRPVAVLINKQVFTKTSNIWGVKNNLRGTNSNRIVLFEKRQ